MRNLINLKCPNCEDDLYLQETEKEIDEEHFDVWKCKNCLHITVLDQRYDVEKPIAKTKEEMERN